MTESNKTLNEILKEMSRANDLKEKELEHLEKINQNIDDVSFFLKELKNLEVIKSDKLTMMNKKSE
ncbi:MAG: hypothetical protein KO202_08400 [Methanobacteriaceae archaeon]|jgi:hypothetical protein|nr:hypothetical protein [Methanobacteriaceae archaeon]